MTKLLTLLLIFQIGTGSIGGRLTKADGSPAAGVRVAAIEQSSREGSAMMSIAQTDSAGRYRLTNIPPGSYFVAAGPADGLRYYSSSSVPSQRVALDVKANQTIDSIDFVFEPWSNILKSTRTRGADQMGRFFGVINKADDRKPMPNVAILLQHAQSGDRFITATDASGAFEFSSLPDGEFSVEVLAPARTGYNGGGFESFRNSITMNASEGLNQDLRLRMVMPPAIARDRTEWYVPPERRAIDPLSPPRAGVGTGIVRGGRDSTSIPSPKAGRGGKGEDRIELQAVVGIDGIVQSLRAMSPDKNPEYTRAALQAALPWRFSPPTLARDGSLVEQFGVITVYFDR